LNFDNEFAAYEWEENEKEMERAWYEQEEDTHIMGEYNEVGL